MNEWTNEYDSKHFCILCNFFCPTAHFLCIENESKHLYRTGAVSRACTPRPLVGEEGLQSFLCACVRVEARLL